MSKPLVVTIPHELGRAEARRRIETGVAQLVGQAAAVGELTQAWEGDLLRFSMRVLGQTISGSVLVAEHDVRLEVLLPAVLGMLAGRLKGKIQDEGRVLLGPPRRP